MFNDGKRISALEGQMKGVQKSVKELPEEISKLKKWTESAIKEEKAREDRRGKIQNDQIVAVEKQAGATEAAMKTMLQRISWLEQQVKMLSK
ncbi:MAG: hypothetical protein ACK4GC_11305 [Paracoccaceae bacterium]